MYSMDFFQRSFWLYDHLLDYADLSQVLETAEQELSNPIIIVDESFKVLHYSKKIELTDEIWVKNIQQGYCTYEFISEVSKIKAFRSAPSSAEAFKVVCHENRITKWVSKILIGGKLAGYIVVPECHAKLTEEQVNLMPIFSKIAAQHVSKVHYQYDSKEFTEEKLLIDLLEGKITDQTELSDRLKWAGQSFKPCKWLILIKAYSNKRLTVKTTRLQTQFHKLFPNVKQLIFKGFLLLLITAKDEQGFSTEKVKQLEDILAVKKMNGLYSDMFTDLLELPRQFDRLKRAQQTAVQLGKMDSLLSYTSMKFYQLLNDFPDNDKQQLISYCHPAVLKLLQYDKENHTDYYQTLQTYLFNNQNINGTAELLYIHRNTMKYRLKKINELIGITLDNGMPIFQLAYSFMILNYLSGKQGDGSSTSF